MFAILLSVLLQVQRQWLITKCCFFSTKKQNKKTKTNLFAAYPWCHTIVFQCRAFCCISLYCISYTAVMCSVHVKEENDMLIAWKLSINQIKGLVYCNLRCLFVALAVVPVGIDTTGLKVIAEIWFRMSLQQWRLTRQKTWALRSDRW